MLDPGHGLSIDQILTLTGRLDDAPGFDTPRERFRRYLREHAADPASARAMIEQCQHAPGEQHHRAFRDLVVHAGRWLGFDPTFGPYVATDGTAAFDGRWRSRSRVTIVVEIRSSPDSAANVDRVVRSVDALKASGEVTGRVAGLIVLTTPAGRHRIDDAIAAGAHGFPMGVVLLRTLLSMAESVAAGGMTHDHVVRVLESNLPGDVVMEMLERAATSGRLDGAAGLQTGRSEPGPIARSEHTTNGRSDLSAVASAKAEDRPLHSQEMSYWIATVGPDHATRPEEFLELVVLRRQVFGLVDSATTTRTAAAPGDRVCFYIVNKGVVGHARVASLTAGAAGLRDAHRFRQLLHVDEVKLTLAAPVALDSETELRLRTAGLVTNRPAPTLVRISRESFGVLTRPNALPLSG